MCYSNVPLFSMAQVNVRPDLPKGVLYMHSSKTRFSLPSVSYINAPTAYVFTATDG